jgi:hypothetical protein
MGEAKRKRCLMAGGGVKGVPRMIVVGLSRSVRGCLRSRQRSLHDGVRGSGDQCPFCAVLVAAALTTVSPAPSPRQGGASVDDGKAISWNSLSYACPARV